jgi:hypothetical protein
MAERNLRNREVPTSEIDDNKRQSHSLSEVGEIAPEVGIPNNGGAFAVQKFSTRQEEDMPRNIKGLLLDILSSFEADVAAAVEMLNSNFKTENTKLAEDITSSLTTVNVEIPGRNPETFGRIDAKISGIDSSTERRVIKESSG